MDEDIHEVHIQGSRSQRSIFLLFTSSRLYALASLVFFSCLVAACLVAYFMHLVAGVSAAFRTSSVSMSRATNFTSFQPLISSQNMSN